MLWERHIIHSLLILKYVEIPYRSRVLDVGTGGGLPGIPLKIARPDIKITLVDSVAKKLNIASMLAQHTALKDITAVCSRVESLSQSAKYKKYFNVIVSRAVAPIAEIVQWTKDVRTEKATIVLLKGGDLTEEINNARKAHKEMVVTVYAIDAIGLPMFTQDEKKIVTCAFL